MRSRCATTTSAASTTSIRSPIVGIIEKPLGKSNPSGQPRDRVRVEYDGIESTDLFAGRRDDLIDVESTPMSSTLTVYTGTGQNTVRVSPTAQTLDTLFGSLSVNGGGTDKLAVDDRASAGFAPYILTSANVVRGPRVMAHTKVENIVLWVNPNGNPIAANAIAPGTTAVVYGNTGNDTLTANAPAGMVQFLGGPVSARRGSSARRPRTPSPSGRCHEAHRGNQR